VSTPSVGPLDRRVELHSRRCSCRGGSWMVFGEASGSPCPGSDGTSGVVIPLSEWRLLGKPADLEAYQEATNRQEAGERREFQRFSAFLPVRLGRIPTWKAPTPQTEDTVTDVVARGGALVRSRMAVEKGDVLTFEIQSFRTRAEVTYVSAPASALDNVQRLGLRFLDAPLPESLIPAGAKPLP
jgi:hypothetical protein